MDIYIFIISVLMLHVCIFHNYVIYYYQQHNEERGIWAIGSVVGNEVTGIRGKKALLLKNL